MISRLRIDDDSIIYYDLWKNIPTRQLRDGDVLKYLEQDLAANQLNTNDIAKYPWIIDLKWEGHSANDIESFRQLLIKHGVKQFGAVFTSYVNVDQLSYPAICLPDRLIYNGNWYTHLQQQCIDWYNMPMTHKLVCPMRRPSFSRAHLAKRLFGILEPGQMIISLGTNEGHVGDEIKQIIYPHPWPLIVDHPSADHVQQHRPRHEKFYTAPVKLVVESSNELDPNVWDSQFVTEKTYKALSWYQLPIWYAVSGLVGRVREQGFDVLDDVIDHRYDLETDPWKRMAMVIAEVKRVTSLNSVQLRNDVWPRLESNATLINGIHNNASSRHKTAITRLKHEIQQLW